VTGKETFHYQGEELDVFAHAQRWKRYWASRIRRWITGDVLEVGAGLGVNTATLQNDAVTSWLCLEPDARLAARLQSAVRALPACSTAVGTIHSVAGRRFDAVLYIDVLEHIEDDSGELAGAFSLLKPEGHVVVLSPAHQFLFSDFDAAIGHYRRYNKRTLRACTPPGSRMVAMFYLDCLGMAASLANRLLLKQSNPTVAQIQTWDTYIIPCSRALDPLTGFSLGKTIVGVWQKPRLDS
jgi:SAM-dependent methyltransferase